MKTRKQKTISKRMRKLLAQQVEEYTHRYHPEMSDFQVEISPCGTFASVKEKKPGGTSA